MALFTFGIFCKIGVFVFLKPVPGEPVVDDVGSPTWVREHRCRRAAQIEWKHLGLIKTFLLWKLNRPPFPTDILTRSGLECGDSPGTAGSSQCPHQQLWIMRRGWEPSGWTQLQIRISPIPNFCPFLAVSQGLFILRCVCSQCALQDELCDVSGTFPTPSPIGFTMETAVIHSTELPKSLLSPLEQGCVVWGSTTVPSTTRYWWWVPTTTGRSLGNHRTPLGTSEGFWCSGVAVVSFGGVLVTSPSSQPCGDGAFLQYHQCP